MTVRSIVRSLVCSGALLVVCSYSSAQGIPCRYGVTHVIQAPPGPFSDSPTYATAISPNGRYVVGYFNFDGAGNDRAFVYDVRTALFHTLPLPPGTSDSFATDVNDMGQITGHAGGAVGSDFGFIYSLPTGQYTLLPPVHRDGICWTTGINASGVTCGYRTIGGPPGYPTSAFIWDEKTGVFTDLGLIDGMSSGATGIADDGMVAVHKGVGLAGYFWDGRRLSNLGWLPGADDIRLWDMQSGARAAGGSLFIVGGSFWVVPFVYRNSALHPVPTLTEALPSCTASAMNPSGLIVGHCRPINNGDDLHAVSWLGAAIRELEPLLIDASGISLHEATAVSDSGHIVCTAGTDPGASISVVLAPVAGINGDTNCNRVVNIDDLLTVIQWWGPGISIGDLNGDQVVNLSDLLLVIDNWTL
jgi:uncharacterized membrane protein